MTRRNGRHPGAVPLDARSLEAIAMLQPKRERWCEGCSTAAGHDVVHQEEWCETCSQASNRPVWHLCE